jgi:tRNA 5-methylaminomethyl-2-thiouridine biosynthesis bifunctional protein
VAQHVVLCTAEAIHELEQTRHIPVICNRGQVDQYAAAPGEADAPVVCGQGYFLPAGADGLISVGGSFSLTGDSPGARAADSALHRAQLAATSRDLAARIDGREPVLQRRATRCTLADRMPVAGLIEASSAGAMLWVNAAHGSQGLARTPLCAAWLSALISRTPGPLDAVLARTVDPGRFGPQAREETK